MEIRNIRKSICRTGKMLFERYLTDSSGGNISVRDDHKVYITERGSAENYQWEIDEDSIIVTDLCNLPLIGDRDQVTRELETHYAIYQNFPEINAVVHCHPKFAMVYGAAHLPIPAVTEGTRDVLGDLSITCIEECSPCSKQQAERIIANFQERRSKDPMAALICNIPFHGIFSAAENINLAFMYAEILNNAAEILIYRKMAFSDVIEADFRVHYKTKPEDSHLIEAKKEVCSPGFEYKDAFGNNTIYGGNGSLGEPHEAIIDLVTKEVLKKLNDS